MLLAPQWENSNSQPLKARFEIEYFLIAVACAGLLLAIITLPFISVGYGIQRLYLQAVVISSTFFILGGIIFAKYCRISPYLIILLVLIPYGMFSTGVLYEVCSMHDKSWILSSESLAYSYEFVYDQKIPAALWLKEHMDEKLGIHTFEGTMLDKLISQGKFSPTKLASYYSRSHGYTFLSYNNVVNGKYVSAGKLYNMSDHIDILMSKNKIYANGGSEIYI